MTDDASHDESSLTMMDILEEQEALQEDAEAVLGAGDDEHCTYEKVSLCKSPSVSVLFAIVFFSYKG